MILKKKVKKVKSQVVKFKENKKVNLFQLKRKLDLKERINFFKSRKLLRKKNKFYQSANHRQIIRMKKLYYKNRLKTKKKHQ